jgi:hypothetical protein
MFIPQERTAAEQHRVERPAIKELRAEGAKILLCLHLLGESRTQRNANCSPLRLKGAQSMRLACLVISNGDTPPSRVKSRHQPTPGTAPQTEAQVDDWNVVICSTEQLLRRHRRRAYQADLLVCKARRCDEAARSRMRKRHCRDVVQRWCGMRSPVLCSQLIRVGANRARRK